MTERLKPAVGDIVYFSDVSEEQAVSDGDMGELISIHPELKEPYRVGTGPRWKHVVVVPPSEASKHD